MVVQEGNIEAIDNRYDRQELIQGWDQSKLSNANLLIIGSNILANYVALNASALGFGNIEVIGPGKNTSAKKMFTSEIAQGNSDYSEGFLYYESPNDYSKVKSLEEICLKINSEIKIKGLNLDLMYENNWNVIKKPDIIIDATNSPESKFIAINYSRLNKIPIISTSTDEFIGKVGYIDPANTVSTRYVENMLFSEIKDNQGDITSMILSALAVDEARKSIMLLNGEQKLTDIVVYNRKSSTLFNLEEDIDSRSTKPLQNKHVLQVGAGSEGNFSALGFVLRDVGKFTLVDDDIVELVNLNRQPFLYGGVGNSKVNALVKKLEQINPRVEYETIRKRVGPNFEAYLAEHKPDVIVDTVDNNKTRALLNYFSLKYNIPLVSGGTRYNSGQAVLSVPGKTACLNCKVDIDKMALDAYTPQSCILAPQPSVITSNQIIAGFLVDQTERILSPRYKGSPVNQIIKYVSGESLRLGLLPAQDTCDCYKTMNPKKWMKTMKHLYVKN